MKALKDPAAAHSCQQPSPGGRGCVLCTPINRQPGMHTALQPGLQGTPSASPGSSSHGASTAQGPVTGPERAVALGRPPRVKLVGGSRPTNGSRHPGWHAAGEPRPQTDPQHSPRPSLCCSPRMASARPVLLASSSWALGTRPCCTTTCRHGGRQDMVHACLLGAGSGAKGRVRPHRPRVACLLQRLASGALSSLHSAEDAAVGAGGLDGPLDEAVLVDSVDDAVGEAGERQSARGPGAHSRQAGLPARASLLALLLPCHLPGVPFLLFSANLGPDFCLASVGTMASHSRIPPRPAMVLQGPG